MNQIKDLFLKHENARLFIEAFETNPYMGSAYEQFEKDLNLKLIGKSELDTPIDHLDYFPAILYCRLVCQQENDETIAKMKIVLEDKEVISKLDALYSGYGKVIVEDFFEVTIRDYEFGSLIKTRRAQAAQTGKKITSWSTGDLFTVELSGSRRLSGVVLCAVKKCLKGKKMDPWSNKLFEFKDHLLVSLFDIDAENVDADDFVLSGCLSDMDAFKDGFYSKAGTRKITLEDIDFPEYLDEGYFVKGELMLPLGSGDQDLHKIKAEFNQNSLNSYLLDHYVLYMTGKKNLIPVYPEIYDLSKTDLRFDREKRIQVFDLLKEDIAATYFDLARKHGIDISNYLK